jgi:DNA-binding transcriptional ArsR family regulator
MGMEFHRIGAALAAPGRARMIERLLDGQEHTSGELAEAAGVTTGTASEHLGVLVEAGLVQVRADGRFRHVRIADHSVAAALEVLSRDQPAPEVTSYRLSAEQRRVRQARTCYDHLAGRLGVAVHDAVAARGWLDGSGTALSDAGRRGLAALGVDLEAVEVRKRPTLLVCVDWTERRPHLAGGVGAALADLAFARAWVRRVPRSRALRITPEGRLGFADELGVRDTAWLPGASVG